MCPWGFTLHRLRALAPIQFPARPSLLLTSLSLTHCLALSLPPPFCRVLFTFNIAIFIVDARATQKTKLQHNFDLNLMTSLPIPAWCLILDPWNSFRSLQQLFVCVQIPWQFECVISRRSSRSLWADNWKIFDRKLHFNQVLLKLV